MQYICEPKTWEINNGMTECGLKTIFATLHRTLKVMWLEVKIIKHKIYMDIRHLTVLISVSHG